MFLLIVGGHCEPAKVAGQYWEALSPLRYSLETQFAAVSGLRTALLQVANEAAGLVREWHHGSIFHYVLLVRVYRIFETTFL